MFYTNKLGLYKSGGKWYLNGKPNKSLFYFTPIFIGLISIILTLAILSILFLTLILLFNINEDNYNPLFKIIKFPIILFLIIYLIINSINSFLLILKDLINEERILYKLFKFFGIIFYLISFYLMTCLIFSPISLYLFEIPILSKSIGLIFLFSILIFILSFFEFFKIKSKFIFDKLKIKDLDEITI